MRRGIVLWHALVVDVHDAEVKLRRRVAQLCGHSVCGKKGIIPVTASIPPAETETVGLALYACQSLEMVFNAIIEALWARTEVIKQVLNSATI